MTRAFYAYPSCVPKQRFRREYYSDQQWADVAYRDAEHARLSDVFLLWQRDRVLRNFDLSMRYFESLDAGEFGAALQFPRHCPTRSMSRPGTASSKPLRRPGPRVSRLRQQNSPGWT
jgi:hypothetical protein